MILSTGHPQALDPGLPAAAAAAGDHRPTTINAAPAPNTTQPEGMLAS